MSFMFLSFENLRFNYDPFPIGLARPVMEEEVYGELVDNFPAIDIFEDYRAMKKPGNKLTLSEKENARVYNKFISSNPIWKEFHRWIKSDDFCYGIMDLLRTHYIDLGYEYSPLGRRLGKRVKDIVEGHPCRARPRLGARFEFSALPADGGHLNPHTDTATKITTIIVSMVRDGEWDPAFGGGTDVNRPKDIRFKYNYLNRLATFDDMEVVHTYEFQPNQAVIFVKTYDSWHSVRPLSGTSGAMRKTLTINIEPRV